MSIKQCEASGKSDHNHFGKPTLNEDTLEFQVTCIIEENESHINFFQEFPTYIIFNSVKEWIK